MNEINLPNTTPVPNEIINGWAKRLKGSELKVLLIVVRKTLGWVLDSETGMRKEEDWITYAQLGEHTGLSTRPLSAAIDGLVNYKLIQVRDEQGNVLDSKEKRQLVGKRRGKIYYRLNLTTLQSTSHYFTKESSTTLQSKDNKINSLQNQLLQNIPQQKSRCPLEDLGNEDLKEKYPNGHKECIEYIDAVAKEKGHKFVNYQKQIMFLHKMLRAGRSFKDMDYAIDRKITGSSFYQEKGWDFSTITQVLDRG